MNSSSPAPQEEDTKSNTSALEATEKTPNHYMLAFSTLDTQVSLILYFPLSKASSYQFYNYLELVQNMAAACARKIHIIPVPAWVMRTAG